MLPHWAIHGPSDSKGETLSGFPNCFEVCFKVFLVFYCIQAPPSKQAIFDYKQNEGFPPSQYKKFQSHTKTIWEKDRITQKKWGLSSSINLPGVTKSWDTDATWASISQLHQVSNKDKQCSVNSIYGCSVQYKRSNNDRNC